MLLDKSSGRPRAVNPTNAAVIGRYYEWATGGEDITPTWAEETLEIVESASAPLISDLGNGSRLSDADRITVALFVALLALRVPQRRDWLKAAEEGMARKHLLDIAEQESVFEQAMRVSGEPTDDPDETERQRINLLEALKGERIDVEAPPERTISLMFELALDLTDVVWDMSWTLLRAPDNHHFVIGDCPVTMFDPEPSGLSGGNALLSSPKAETVLPLDPEFALLLTPGPRGLDETVIDGTRLGELNLRSYAWAERWLMGRSQGDVADVRAAAKKSRRRVAALAPRHPRLVFESKLVDGRHTVAVVDAPSAATKAKRARSRRRGPRAAHRKGG